METFEDLRVECRDRVGGDLNGVQRSTNEYTRSDPRYCSADDQRLTHNAATHSSACEAHSDGRAD
jgi:hypothetical protein